MSDITFALEAKSDQLNAVDIIASDRTIKITNVDVKKSDQPVSIYFEGDHGRPWKPSKGMLRVLALAWGSDSKQWVGKYAQLYHDPGVIYAGKAVGGIRVRALSDIDRKGLNLSLAISRSRRDSYHVKFLEVSNHQYPDEHFQKALPTMIKLMTDGKKTLQQIIAQCQKTGQLSADQIKQLEDAAPVVADCETEGKEH
jgi:hypothetical protein